MTEDEAIHSHDTTSQTAQENPPPEKKCTKGTFLKLTFTSFILVVLAFSYQSYVVYDLKKEVYEQKNQISSLAVKLSTLQTSLTTLESKPEKNYEQLSSDLKNLKDDHETLKSALNQADIVEKKIQDIEEKVTSLKSELTEKITPQDEVKKEEVKQIPLTSSKLPKWLNDFLSEIDVNKSSPQEPTSKESVKHD